jgi:type I protein arginine methyltransferase
MSASGPATEKYARSSGSSEASDLLDMKDEEGWEDAEPDEEETQFISLLDDEVFADIMSMLNHCKAKHDFDFLAVRQNLGLDFYGSIRLVNFVRSQVHSGNPVSSDISKEQFEDERFLKPVLEDDALLFSLDELPDVMEMEGVEKGKGVSKDPRELVARVSQLEEELRRIQMQFDNYRATVTETLDDRWNDKSASGPSGSAGKDKNEKRDDDSHYFTSYSYNGQSISRNQHTSTDWNRYPRNHVEGHSPNRRLPGLYLQPQIRLRRQNSSRRWLRHRYPQHVLCQSRCRPGYRR